MSKMVNTLMRQGYLKTDRVIEAFSDVDRAEFLPEKYQRYADANIPLPVGGGQIITQPAAAAVMLELLDLQEGQSVLNVGVSTGWTTTLLDHVVGKNGVVVGIEIDADILEQAKKNLSNFGFISANNNVTLVCKNGIEGYVEKAPYDRILVSATASMEPPQALKDQLKVGGRMVIPVGENVLMIEKTSETDYVTKERPGFGLMPLVE
ncbi:MAG: protein-L-isoaspartate O-methyltransferase [Candidatus Moranbacteria bacterium]|nr:protein-L-isoaspartate O-methyltransferase [Candidatus Moranbacteria bacterium]